MSLPLALTGFAVVNGAMIHYFATIAKERVPVDVRPHSAAFGAGGLLGLAGIIAGPSAATLALGIMAASTGGFLLWLISQRRTPDGELIAKIGETLPDLSAPNQDGEQVRIADLRGRRVLLKFYRGHW